MAIKRMDHVVDDLEAAIAFFVELGMERVGEVTPVEGRWVDRVVGLDDVRVDITFVQTPDGHSRLELTTFRNPAATTAEPNAPGEHARPPSDHVSRRGHRGRRRPPAGPRR